MNECKFADAMMVLSVAFREQVSETMMVIYYDALDDLPEEMVLSAMAESVKACKFFPRVAEIRELATKVQQAAKDTERARRIQEQRNRDRQLVDDWKKDRVVKSIPAPVAINSLVKKVIEELTPEQVEERKQKLR